MFMALANPVTRDGWVKLWVVAVTMLAAGRFCVSCARESLGRWRRRWIVYLLIGAIMYLTFELHWALAAAPFLPLAGVICAAYLACREFIFGRAEQALAVLVWLAQCGVSWETYLADAANWGWRTTAGPLAAWVTGRVLTGMGMKVCAWRRFTLA